MRDIGDLQVGDFIYREDIAMFVTNITAFYNDGIANSDDIIVSSTSDDGLTDTTMTLSE
jgi:hypothetical protein